MRSGFFWIQCSPAGLAFMENWLAAAYAADSLMDVWEQMVFGTLIFTKPPTVRCAYLPGCRNHAGRETKYRDDDVASASACRTGLPYCVHQAQQSLSVTIRWVAVSLRVRAQTCCTDGLDLSHGCDRIKANLLASH